MEYEIVSGEEVEDDALEKKLVIVNNVQQKMPWVDPLAKDRRPEVLSGKDIKIKPRRPLDAPPWADDEDIPSTSIVSIKPSTD